MLDSLNIDFVNENELLDFENKLKENGYLKVFDTKKKDHHYYKEGMNTKVQLQEIDDIGLLVYLDNSNYYELPLEEQRNKLIDELNSYGFDFKYTDLGLDKLRTLYYQEKNIVKIKMVKAELHKCSFFFGNKVFYSTYFLTISTRRLRPYGRSN